MYIAFIITNKSNIGHCVWYFFSCKWCNSCTINCCISSLRYTHVWDWSIKWAAMYVYPITPGSKY